jgi:hypothetical protein
MQLLARYTRIYALSPTREATPRNHPASPIRLVDVPSPGIHSEIHIGAVPDGTLQGLKFQRAWIERVFHGGFKDADELRRLAVNISEETVLSNRRDGDALQPHWYVTFCVDDHVELPENPKQELLGVVTRSWVDLDNPTFFEKHTETLDQLAAQMAISVAPYRYRWRVWDGPIVHLPTGIALRPPQLRMGRPRGFVAPSLQGMNLSAFSAAPSMVFKSIGMVWHFYLRSVTEPDRISRFFDAFRGLEVLCQSLEAALRAKASANCVNIAATAPEAVQKFGQKQRHLRKSFATIALALNPTAADDDLDIFNKLYDWRNDLAHGKRKLQPDDAPDEEAFELLHKYIANVT